MQVGSKVLFALWLVALKVQIPKVHVEARLRVHGSNDHETALGRPVDGVAVLAVRRAHQLEAAQDVALLLGGKERHGSLGGHRSTAGSLTSGDDDETVSIGFPGKVNHGVLETVDNLDGHPLLAHPEDFEVGGQRLLGLGVTVDLDTDVGALGLPVQLDIGDVEQIPGSHDFLGRNAHHSHTRGVAAHFRGPEAQQLLVLLHPFALGRRRRPFKVHDSFDLDRRLA